MNAGETGTETATTAVTTAVTTAAAAAVHVLAIETVVGTGTTPLPSPKAEPAGRAVCVPRGRGSSRVTAELHCERGDGPLAGSCSQRRAELSVGTLGLCCVYCRGHGGSRRDERDTYSDPPRPHSQSRTSPCRPHSALTPDQRRRPPRPPRPQPNACPSVYPEWKVVSSVACRVYCLWNSRPALPPEGVQGWRAGVSTRPAGSPHLWGAIS